MTQRKEDPLDRTKKNEVYKEVFGEYETDGYIYIEYASMDDKGKYLYLAREKSDHSLNYRMLIIGNFLYSQKINNLTLYQEELAAFKCEHNWGKS